MRRKLKWWLWIRFVRLWADTEMDQWENVKTNSKFGPIYISIHRSVLNPEIYDQEG